MVMANVNPPPIPRIPRQFLQDVETRGFFQEVQRILFQLWLRSGGGSDAIQNASGISEFDGVDGLIDRIEELEALDVGSHKNLEDLEALEPSYYENLIDRLEELESAFDDPVVYSEESNVIEIGSAITAYTTTGDEDIIICNNSAALTITMTTPEDGHKTTYIRRDAAVSLVGTLNGGTPTSIPSKYDILDVYYTIDGGEFSA